MPVEAQPIAPRMTPAEWTEVADEDLELLLFIRHFERMLLKLFAEGKLNGTTHTCIGQEAIPVALRPLLRDPDFILGNHRSHGHYLCKFGDPIGLLAEIMGREGAVCGGVGGSQHIWRDGRYLSTGVQGETLPVACGVAIHLKRRGDHALAVAHIGDGTWGEGAVYEALNVAQLWQLPLLVVVENNGISQTTPTQLQMAGTIEGRVRAFGMRYLRISGNDVNRIRKEIGEPIEAVRRESSPLVIEFETDRLGPHSKGDDTRPEASLNVLKARDWLPRYRALFPAQVERLEAQVLARLEETLAEVSRRPLSRWDWR